LAERVRYVAAHKHFGSGYFSHILPFLRKHILPFLQKHILLFLRKFTNLAIYKVEIINWLIYKSCARFRPLQAPKGRLKGQLWHVQAQEIG
jgi:hypothetical protein